MLDTGLNVGRHVGWTRTCRFEGQAWPHAIEPARWTDDNALTYSPTEDPRGGIAEYFSLAG